MAVPPTRSPMGVLPYVGDVAFSQTERKIVHVWKSRVAALSEGGRPEAAWPASKPMRSSTKL